MYADAVRFTSFVAPSPTCSSRLLEVLIHYFITRGEKHLGICISYFMAKAKKEKVDIKQVGLKKLQEHISFVWFANKKDMSRKISNVRLYNLLSLDFLSMKVETSHRKENKHFPCCSRPFRNSFAGRFLCIHNVSVPNL